MAESVMYVRDKSRHGGKGTPKDPSRSQKDLCPVKLTKAKFTVFVIQKNYLGGQRCKYEVMF